MTLTTTFLGANNIMFENDSPKTLLECTSKKRSCKASYMDNIQMVENQKNQFSVYIRMNSKDLNFEN
jgi:hypothetical protein